jgi:hypothetical protein
MKYSIYNVGHRKQISRDDVRSVLIALIQFNSCHLDIELVKQNHPDSQLCRNLSPAERHRRFQMISSAYDTLRLKRDTQERDRSTWEEIDRRKRAYYRHSRRAEYEYTEWKNPRVDDRWTDRVILAFGFVVSLFFI